jgi:hypothetical protein
MGWFEFRSAWKAPAISSATSIRRYAEDWQHSHSILIWSVTPVSVTGAARYHVIYLAVSGDAVVAAVQDINPKVTGALFLREFMARYPAVGVGAATRVLVPGATASAEKIRSLLSQFSTAERRCEEIAVLPRTLGDDRHVCTNLSIGWRSGANPGADACR